MKPPLVRQPSAERVNALHEFAPEGSAARKPAPASRDLLTRGHTRRLFIAGALVILSGLTVLAFRRLPMTPFSSAPKPATVTIDTRPVGSEVIVDGEQRGVTPLKLSLPPGPHTIAVRLGNDERVVPLTLAAGAEVSHSFEMKAAEPPVLLGGLSVVTDPPGAAVAVDGKPRGVSPVTVTDLTAAQHIVTVTGAAGVVERTVLVSSGVTKSVMYSLPKRAGGPIGGWLAIASPFDVEVVENGEVIGSSAMARVMVAAGRHDIVLSSRSVGFADARRIDVVPGKTIAIRIDPPMVPVGINARPWAEIAVDGQTVGQTPIANLSLTIGPHEVRFRHPQFGERKQTVVVMTKGPNRITMDLTR
jgi:hypothetical protein